MMEHSRAHAPFSLFIEWKWTWRNTLRSTVFPSTMPTPRLPIINRFIKSASYRSSLRLSRVPRLPASHMDKPAVERPLLWWARVMVKCPDSTSSPATTSFSSWTCIRTWSCISASMKSTAESFTTCWTIDNLSSVGKTQNSKLTSLT